MNSKIIKQAYEEIWDEGKKYEYKVLKEETVNFEQLAHFIPMKGEKYDCSNIKLMIIGRAVNGWFTAENDNKDEYGKHIETKLETSGFDWVYSDENGVLHNKKTDANGNEVKGDYVLSSPFWNYSKEIFYNLAKSDETITSDKRWIEYVVWTNLYKIAPTYMGNPDEKLKKLQQSQCEKMLKAEIELFKPTHILAMTGWKGWMENFSGIFNDVHMIEKNSLRKGKNNSHLEATAVYKIEERSIPVAVACRPEWRNKGDFLEDVLRAFKNIDCTSEND